jgi:PhnB protein
MAVKPVPDGYSTVSPYLIVADPAVTIDFLKATYGAVERERMSDDSGAIRHAEVAIGESVIMMGGARPDWPAMPCMTHVYVPDVDAAYARALEAGATAIMPPADQFYGDRSGGVRGPDGNLWWMATHVEDVSPEEILRRHEARLKEQATA